MGIEGQSKRPRGSRRAHGVCLVATSSDRPARPDPDPAPDAAWAAVYLSFVMTPSERRTRTLRGARADCVRDTLADHVGGAAVERGPDGGSPSPDLGVDALTPDEGRTKTNQDSQPKLLCSMMNWLNTQI